MGRFFQKTPTVIQMEALECGAAALSMILGHYGRFVSLEQLRVACAVSRDGSKASNILKAARHYGLVAKGYKRELEDLKELTLPAILFWEFNHFVVLNKVRGDRYYLKDPGVGDRCLSEAEFSRSFTGVVLEFEPGPDFKAGGEKPSLIANLLAPFRKQYAFVSYTALLCVLLVSSAFAAPALIRAITDDIFIRDLRGHFWPLLLVVSTIMLFRAALVHLQALHHNRFSYQATRQMSASTLWHLLTLPMQFFGQRYAGDLANRIQSGPLIAQLSTKLFSRLMLLGLSALGLAILLVRYSLSIVLAVFALFVLNVVVYLLLIRMKKDREQRFLMERDRVFSNLMSGLSTIESLKASGRESEFFARFGGFWAKAQNVKNSLGPSEALVTALPFLLATLSSAVVWSLGALGYYQATMTIGMIVAARFLSEQLFSSVEELTQSQAQVEAFSHAFRRINDVMNYEPAPEWTSRLDTTEVQLSGSVTLDRVSFAYDRYAPMVVEDISIDIKAQSRVAFVGATGSGKSTIGKLIAGFYVPQNGEVRFDGLARTQIAHASLTKHMAYVEQEIYLFSGTILENLTLFDASIAFEDVVQAAQDAMIHDDIINIFGGYDAHVAEGGKNLSGGQIQRLEIARALVRKPKLLILDEATSALDPPTEKRIDDNLKKRGCTLILIAHRLSTIRDADEIIVLDQGHIVQRGTHETLMKAPGPYHTLIQKSG